MIDDKWVVADVDRGPLYGASTKGDCLEWILTHGGVVLMTKKYGPGDYEYNTGYVGEETQDNWFLMKNDLARRHAFDLDVDVRRCRYCKGYSVQENGDWTCKSCGHMEEGERGVTHRPDGCTCSPDRNPGYRIIDRATGQRAEAGDESSAVICAGCKNEIHP